VNARVKLAIGVAVVSALVIAVTTAAAGGGQRIRERLSSYQEVPALSTAGSGEFRARLRLGQDEISYSLSYADLTGAVQQAHIHLGQTAVSGAISVFLCTNLDNGPAGTQACPPAPATIEGTIRPADVVGPAAQGLAAGEFDELVNAIFAGVTYVNVHSATFPNGEIRAQLNVRGDD
jgi:CHRD domain